MPASRPGESSFHPALLASDPASAADGGGAAASATPSTATAAVEVALRASYTGVAPATTPTAAVDGVAAGCGAVRRPRGPPFSSVLVHMKRTEWRLGMTHE